jgi:hypothetical protein
VVVDGLGREGGREGGREEGASLQHGDPPLYVDAVLVTLAWEAFQWQRR